MNYAMPKMFASALVGTMLLAGSALAGDVLSERQLDSITAGADIVTTQRARAAAVADITTDANHDVFVLADTNTAVSATVVADKSAAVSSLSESALDTSTIMDTSTINN